MFAMYGCLVAFFFLLVESGGTNLLVVSYVELSMSFSASSECCVHVWILTGRRALETIRWILCRLLLFSLVHFSSCFGS